LVRAPKTEDKCETGKLKENLGGGDRKVRKKTLGQGFVLEKDYVTPDKSEGKK